MDSASIDTPCAEYTAMEARWKLPLALLGGSQAMRDGATDWLPQHRFEAQDDYRRRIRYSNLYPGFESALETVSSRPFEQSVKLTLPEGETLPDWLQAIVDDMDLRGSNLTSFVSQFFRCGWKFGLAHVVSRFPKDAPTENARDMAASGARPFFELWSPHQVIGWRWALSKAGAVVFEHVRLAEDVTIPVGTWGESKQKQIRVITPTEWAIYRPGQGSWTRVDGGAHTFGRVPIRTYYVKRASRDDGFSGVMTALPPLEAVAETNLAHFRSSADQRNILTTARVPILFGKQLGDRKPGETLAIGPNSIVETTDKDGDLKFVEHTGAAIEAGERDLAHLETEMQVQGMQPFASKVEVTATKENRDEAKSTSQIKRSIRDAEAFVLQLLADAAEWSGETLPEGLGVQIFDDFALLERAAEDMQHLLELRRAQCITRKTLLEEAKRRGKVSETVDVEREIDAADNDQPLGMLGFGADPTGGGGAPDQEAA